MSDFKVVEIIDGKTFRVEPSWQLPHNENNFIGDKVIIRGLDIERDDIDAKLRLKEILLNTKSDIVLNSPELIEYSDINNATVSCSVYLGETNVVYYFPEYIHK